MKHDGAAVQCHLVGKRVECAYIYAAPVLERNGACKMDAIIVELIIARNVCSCFDVQWRPLLLEDVNGT